MDNRFIPEDMSNAEKPPIIIFTKTKTYAHEYREKDNRYCNYGFGATPELAREDAVYGPDGEDDAARDHSLGYGDWMMVQDEDESEYLLSIRLM